MANVNLIINGVGVAVPEGSTILDAAKVVGIDIPTLCYMKLHDFDAVNQTASCRVCMVEIVGRGSLVPACSTYVYEGMEVLTTSKRAVLNRRIMVELLLTNHPSDCLICEKNHDCDLQSLAAMLGVRGKSRFSGDRMLYERDSTSRAIYRNPEKCIMCRRCETMCNQVQTCGILSAVHRGYGAVVQPALELPLVDTMCTFCGQCVSVCPTAALTALNNVSEAWDAIYSDDKIAIVQVAPAVRFALGEEFDLPGENVMYKLPALLRRLGFDYVFDTDFGADPTVMEETEELMARLGGKGRLPMLTSCCPAWVKFIEHQFPDLLDVPSTCKSPHEMTGAITKGYFAEKMGIDPKKIVMVSIMPCVAKKYEATREELHNDGMPNVDIVLTTRELAKMIREAGIHFSSLPDEEYDSPMGESTGAGVIFGVTGGVIEAVVRSVARRLIGEEAPVEFEELRSLKGIREAMVTAGDTTLKIGIAHGLGNARMLLESIQRGEADYHAIEIMACPGGCICGGGQPYHHGNMELMHKRRMAVYEADRSMKKRLSDENESLKKLYEEYLGEPGGHRSHELLHTTYKARDFI